MYRVASRRAFTLLELILAMSMVAILSVSLFASLRIAFKAREVSERAVAPGRTAEQVMEFLRADLQCALPPRGVLAGSFSGTDSQDDRGNDADDLLFYSTTASPMHIEGSNGEIKKIELTITQPPNSTDHVLVRRCTNNLLNPQQEIGDDEVLCRNVYGFNLRYFDGNTWQDNWESSQNTDSLPMAVEVILSLDSKQQNADGTPMILTYRRVFMLPCYGQTNGPTTGLPTDGAAASGAGGGAGTPGKTNTPAAPSTPTLKPPSSGSGVIQ